MPWCDECARFLSPSTVRPDGTCPKCGRTVGSGDVATSVAAQRADEADEDLPPIPWHLKLLALAILVYLAYRLYQGIGWVTG
jgi:hypothetical protein